MASRFIAGHAVTMAALMVAIIAVPDLAPAVWATLGLLGVGGMGAWIWSHGPLRRTPWLLLAAGALSLGGAMVIAALPGGRRGVIAAVCVITVTLVVSGLTDAVEQQGRSVERERHLREACSALLRAADADAVAAAMRTALGALMPPGAPHRVVFVTSGEACGAAWQPCVSIPAPWPTVATSAPRHVRVVQTRMLPPALIEHVGDLRATMVSPLGCDAFQGGPLGISAMLVAGDERVLATVCDLIAVLVGQASLALERIQLADEANRRDGEAYLDAVARNTADVVLILADGERIQYASPSLRRLLGVEPPAFATWREVIHADDQNQVSRALDLARAGHDPRGVPGEWNLRRADGTLVHVEACCRDLRGDRTVNGLVITMRDITERRRTEQDVIRRALQDSAPGRNRRSLRSRFR